MRSIHQLLPVLTTGDAIGSATLRTQAILRELGYRSEIFVDTVDRRMLGLARSASELPFAVGQDDAVIYRLAIGSTVARVFEHVIAKKVLVYHNITPAAYYVGANPEVVYWLERGRDDLYRLAPLCDLVIADSSYNLSEAIEAGARRHVVIPPAIDLTRLSPFPATGSKPPVVLFVGRVAPNKRHDVLLRTLKALQATTQVEAKLVMVGTADDTGRYLTRLRALARKLGVDDSTVLDGRRHTDRQLAAYYGQADIFATASEHEGFCVPAVEAMCFSLPVVAYAAGAIPETVGGGGLLLHTHDPLVWAAVIHRVLTDHELRRFLVEAGRRRAANFSEDKYRERLAASLDQVGLTPA